MDDAPFLGIYDFVDPQAQQLDVRTGFSSIRMNDPSFVEDALFARATRAYLALKDAWQKRDLEAARPYLSPGLALMWQTQIDQLTAAHLRTVVDGPRIDGVLPLSIVPVRVTHGRTYDTVGLRFETTCAEYQVDERTGKALGDRTPRAVREFWSFQRSVDAKSRSEGDAAEQHCPNCGAPLSITQIGECRHCHAAVTSGQFDWVVSRMERVDADADT